MVAWHRLIYLCDDGDGDEYVDDEDVENYAELGIIIVILILNLESASSRRLLRGVPNVITQDHDRTVVLIADEMEQRKGNMIG